MNLRTHFTQPATFLQRWGFLAIPCAIMIVLLWLPFGFSITGLIEEWDVLALFTLHEPFVWVGPESPLAAHRLRPLTIAPHAIGYMLDRNSFAYWHLLLMGSLLLKGIGASLAGWWLTHSRRWAVVFGLLVVLYPADTMQLSFRSFHINWSIALSLLGVAACAYGYTLRKSRQQTLAMLLAVPCAVLATFAYEAALTFVVVPLLLLYARFGLRGALGLVKRHRWVTAWWILGVAINIGYVLYVKGSGATYQDTLVGPTIDLMDRLQRVIGVGFGRTVLGGWLDAIAICWYEYRTRLYLLLSAVLIGYAVWRSSRPLPQEDGVAEIAATSASVVRMAIIALVMIGLGYLPFAASLPHLLISQRTFLGASPRWCAALRGRADRDDPPQLGHRRGADHCRPGGGVWRTNVPVRALPSSVECPTGPARRYRRERAALPSRPDPGHHRQARSAERCVDGPGGHGDGPHLPV